jgi:hypothetical protein
VAAEFEELKLVVSLDSTAASQQLARLRRDIQEIGGGVMPWFIRPAKRSTSTRRWRGGAEPGIKRRQGSQQPGDSIDGSETSPHCSSTEGATRRSGI